MIRVAGFLLLTLGLTQATSAADPDALWHIVHDKCVPHQQQDGNPAPCAEVDLGGGYVVLKDIVGKTQFLVMPTARVGGVESPEILASNAPNYWEAAWRARHFVNERAGHPLPRDVIGLAINSVSGRTQNQLHIHVDCVRPAVSAALGEHADAIGAKWTRFPVPLIGHGYMAMRLEQPELGGVNPFALVADGVPGARDDMAHETLVVIGARFAGKDGFVLLADRASTILNDRGSGEQLLDHECAAAAAEAH